MSLQQGMLSWHPYIVFFGVVLPVLSMIFIYLKDSNLVKLGYSFFYFSSFFIFLSFLTGKVIYSNTLNSMTEYGYGLLNHHAQFGQTAFLITIVAVLLQLLNLAISKAQLKSFINFLITIVGFISLYQLSSGVRLIFTYGAGLSGS